MNRFHAIPFATIALAASLAASAQGMQAHVLIVENDVQVQRWINAPPAQRAGDAYRLRSVPVGKKIMMPVVVTGVQAPQGDVRVTADFEMLAPDGKVVASAPGCCRGNMKQGDPSAPMVLQPMIDVTADPGDMPGEYSVRYTVSDGKSKVVTTEKFQLAAAPGREGPRPSGPDARSEMKAGSPEAAKAPALNSGGSRPGDKDMRHCLSLPTQQEILKCAGSAR